MRSIHNWTDEEKNFLRICVQDHTWAETAEEFNRKFDCDLSRDAVKAAGDRYGIRTGRNGRFEKGSIPANKGKKMSADTYKKCAPTMFYKGQPPTNHKPVGTVSVRNNYKRGTKCVYEKIAEPNIWRRKSVLEWERHNGPVPKGKMIIFADGDPLNTDISNLMMIDMSQNAVMNHQGIRGTDRESMEAAVNVASVKIKISERKRGIKRHGSSKRVER